MKRWIALTLCMCMALGLFAGCGQQQNTETPAATVAPTAAPTQTAAPTATPEPTEEPEPAPVAAPIPYDEYERGIWYGFLPDELADADPDATVVTWRQFCDMLGRFIERYQPESLPAWEEQTAAATDEPMKRDGGMIALLFAARTCGIDYYNVGSPDTIDLPGFTGYDLAWEYPVFAWEEPYFLLDRQKDDGDAINAIGGSYYYSFCYRISLLTGSHLLDMIDGAPHVDDGLTLRVALTAATRLYESNYRPAYAAACLMLERVKQTPEVQAIVSAAEERKQAILNSETKIVKSDTYIQGETYTGTAYYVSNSGDDTNDGTSPETAWATVARLASAEFQFGDAIFFERGGLWREVEMPISVRNTEGLTISAYGEGEKPRLYGSPENGGGAEKWELYYEGPDGEKIWRFYRDMPETTVVVMNDGETYAVRDIPFWDGTNFLSPDDTSAVYDMEAELRDMEYFLRLPYADEPFEKMCVYYAGVDENGVYSFLEGALYLRCDAGNPGELYNSIEFATAHSMCNGTANHFTLDNLNFSYCNAPCGGTATMPSGEGIPADYIYMQYCEAGWGGGKVKYYTTPWDTSAEAIAFVDYGTPDEDPVAIYDYKQDGGAFNVNGSHERTLNNYGHHQFQECVTLETFANINTICEDNLFQGNLIEYCGMGMTLTNWDRDPREPHILSNIRFEDNIVLYSGFDLFLNREALLTRSGPYTATNYYLVTTHAFATQDVPNAHDGTVSVSGNVFAFSPCQLLQIEAYSEEYSRIYDGNTYAQLPGAVWLHEADYVRAGDPNPPYYYITDPDEANEWLQDKHATIIRFDQ